MYAKQENDTTIRIQSSSSMKAIDRILNDCSNFLLANELSPSSNFKQITREALINAIDHGNKNDINKNIFVSIDITDTPNVVIKIKDEGDGFDINSIDLSIPENIEKFRNRGIGIINALCDNVEFNSSGNEITMYIQLLNETEFDLEEDDDSITITPTGDISAGVYDKFLNILISLVDKNKSKYIFNFEKVESCDSISIGLFLKFSKTINKTDSEHELIVINMNEDMKMLFNITRLSSIYKIK